MFGSWLINNPNLLRNELFRSICFLRYDLAIVYWRSYYLMTSYLAPLFTIYNSFRNRLGFMFFKI